MTDKPEKLKIGWVIYEEVGVCVINDYATSMILTPNPCSEIGLPEVGVCSLGDDDRFMSFVLIDFDSNAVYE